MSIKYIVTGGAGFIGSNLVRELNARGEKDILITLFRKTPSFRAGTQGTV